MLNDQSGVLVAVERLVVETLVSKGLQPPIGLASLASSALLPMTRPLSHFRTSLGLDPSGVDLPPLIESTTIQMAYGLNRTCENLSKKLGDVLGPSLSIVGGDSDIHPGYRFSAVFEGRDRKRKAFKFRNGTAELFLSRVLARLEIDRSIFVPAISCQTDGLCVQDFVESSRPTEPRGDFFWYDAGRYIALCDIIGLNDMHDSNVLSVKSKLAVVDAETIFQEEPLGLAPRYSALRSHCLFPFGYEGISGNAVHRAGYAEGCLAKALREEVGNSDDQSRLFNLLLEGYKTWSEVAGVILDEIGDGMTVRNVRFPTAVYGELLSSTSARHYYSSQPVFRDALLERMDALWNEQSERNLLDAEVLSRCQIPFHERVVSPLEARTRVSNSVARIGSSFQERLEGLCASVSQAMRSSGSIQPPQLNCAHLCH